MNAAVPAFLNLLRARPELLAAVKVQSKDEVLIVAAGLGFVFTGDEYDAWVWDAEARVARWRGERFDAQFTLWQTLWGSYYLDYVITDLLSSLDETGLPS
jgi:hypothetical protein